MPKPLFRFFSDDFIKECLGLQQPVESEEVRTSNAAERAQRERLNASVSQVVRKSDRSGKGVCFSKGLPQAREGTYKCGHDGKSKKQIRWEHDPHRLMVCDMKGFLDNVVDVRFGGKSAPGSAQEEDKRCSKSLSRLRRIWTAPHTLTPASPSGLGQGFGSS